MNAPRRLADVPLLTAVPDDIRQPTRVPPIDPSLNGPTPPAPQEATDRRSAALRAEVADWLATKTVTHSLPTGEVPTSEVEWPLVVTLRRAAADEIARRIEEHRSEGNPPMTADDQRLHGRSVIRDVVREHAVQLHNSGQALWDLSTELQYAVAVEHAVFGYGRWQPLFEIPDAENIEITGWDSVQVQYGDGSRREHPPVADSDEELVEAVRFLGEMAQPSRPFDDAHPTMTLALGDRFRLHAIGFGLSHRPSITIRQHTMTSVTLRDLATTQMMPRQLADFLAAAIRARKSIVISGDQGAGKTTLLRALIAEIPLQERFGTLETDYELLTHLQPGRKNMVALQARSGMGELQDGRRVGEVTVADLMPEALRQNLTRLVVGEVRGAEAGAMFEAAQAGSGLLATTHAHSAASSIDRLAARVAQGGVVSIAEAYHQIAHHLHLLIHVKLVDDAWRGGSRTRFVSEVHSLTGAVENGRPVTHLTYRYEPGQQPYFHPEAALADELAAYHVETP